MRCTCQASDGRKFRRRCPGRGSTLGSRESSYTERSALRTGAGTLLLGLALLWLASENFRKLPPASSSPANDSASILCGGCNPRSGQSLWNLIQWGCGAPAWRASARRSRKGRKGASGSRRCYPMVTAPHQLPLLAATVSAHLCSGRRQALPAESTAFDQATRSCASPESAFPDAPWPKCTACWQDLPEPLSQ